MKKFVYTNPNPPNNLVVGSPAYNDATRPPGLTDDQFLDFAVQRNRDVGLIRAGTVVQRVDDANFPTGVSEEKFFGSWEFDAATNSVIVNFTKAIALHRVAIAAAAEQALEIEDKEFRRADDETDGTGRAASRLRRRTLRGLATQFDLSSATTPEQLDALWPTELPAR